MMSEPQQNGVISKSVCVCAVPDMAYVASIRLNHTHRICITCVTHGGGGGYCLVCIGDAVDCRVGDEQGEGMPSPVVSDAGRMSVGCVSDAGRMCGRGGQ